MVFELAHHVARQQAGKSLQAHQGMPHFSVVRLGGKALGGVFLYQLGETVKLLCGELGIEAVLVRNGTNEFLQHRVYQSSRVVEAETVALVLTKP